MDQEELDMYGKCLVLDPISRPKNVGARYFYSVCYLIKCKIVTLKIFPPYN